MSRQARHPFRVRVKVCGFTRREDVDRACHLGVDALGFNFYPPSPRHVSHAKANELLLGVTPPVISIGLLVRPIQSSVEELVRKVPGLRCLQLHGLAAPPEWKVPRPWIAAFAPAGAADLLAIDEFIRASRHIPTPPISVLIDGHAPGLEGGTGKTAPWNLLEGYDPGLPWILAGGLTPDNISQALAILRPWAVDIASGVEDAPGIKSAAKMRELLQRMDQPPVD